MFGKNYLCCSNHGLITVSCFIEPNSTEVSPFHIIWHHVSVNWKTDMVLVKLLSVIPLNSVCFKYAPKLLFKLGWKFIFCFLKRKLWVPIILRSVFLRNVINSMLAGFKATEITDTLPDSFLLLSGITVPEFQKFRSNNKYKPEVFFFCNLKHKELLWHNNFLIQQKSLAYVHSHSNLTYPCLDMSARRLLQILNCCINDH